MYKTILILIFIGLFLPLGVSAAFLDVPIVPCGREGTNDCTLCDIFQMIDNIIRFIRDLTIVLAPVFIAVGGIIILFSGAKPDQIALGKKMITFAIIGVVIALLSWTLINMVFNAFVGEGFKWNKIECEVKVGLPPGEDRCNEMSYAGICLGSAYHCQRGIKDQISDASTELRSLLDCMKDRLPSSEAREISSISDNSGGRCFNNWNSQCSGSVDSCTGTCCGHSQNSFHYGGRNCRGTSYAVDFAKESFFSYIHNAAKTCATDLALGKIDVVHEGNHVHIELEGVAKNKGCI